MSAPGKAKAENASGAKPRPEGSVRERGWRPTRQAHGIGLVPAEAKRRRAIAQTADKKACRLPLRSREVA